jgi:hypothetical protein
VSYASKAEFGADLKRALRGDKAAKARVDAWAGRARDHRGATVRDARAVVPEARQTSRAIDITIPGQRVNASAVKRAVEILGITWNVTIRFVTSLKQVDERYVRTGDHMANADGSHLILLVDGRTAAQTTRTLLHELTHCVQSEGFRSRHRWLLAYADETNRNGYEGNRFEQEAHEVARLLAHLRLVT